MIHINSSILLLLLVILFRFDLNAQQIESITFSTVTSTNDNFQPVVGAPYSATLSSANGSLEISSSYGDATYEETTLSTEELKLQSSIRVFPNPTTYLVSIDLTQLPKNEYQLFLVDFSGKTVYKKQTGNNVETIDMNVYNTGIYSLQVQIKGAKTVNTFKIVKK